MSAATKAVFLSYASQDADAARRICEALRGASVEVWLDQSELVGGDAWDQKIRQQIKECALFIPVISANTQARREGYFRREWKQAAARTHDMADGTPFLLPVVIDATRDTEALVPEEFRTVQWTKLPAGSTPPAFCARVMALLGGSDPAPVHRAPAQRLQPGRKPSRPWRAPALAFLAAVLLLPIWQPWKQRTMTTAKAKEGAPLSDARKLVAQAREFYEGGDDMNRENLHLAEDLLKRAMTLDSTDGEVWAAQAQVSHDMLDFGQDRSIARRDALRMQADRAMKLSPRSLEAKIAYGGYLLKADVEADAIRLLQPLAALAPNNRRLFHLLARAFEMEGRFDEALAALDHSAGLPGGNPGELARKAQLLMRLGRFEEAEDAVAHSLAQRTTSRAQWVDVLLKLTWRGDFEGAVAALEKWPGWLRLEDRGAFTASQVWFWQQKTDQALALLRAVPRDYLHDNYFVGPKSVLLAVAYEMAGRPDAARTEWENVKKVVERVLAEDPSQKRLLAWKATALARLGEKEHAERLLRELEQTGDLRMEYHSCVTAGALLPIALGRGSEVPAKIEQRRHGVERWPQAALRLNPVFEPIRSDPAFQELVKKAAAPKPKTAAASAATQPPMDSAPAKSVAVLAFKNLSDDQGSAYFSDGISDELTSVLGRVPGLRVAGSTSAFSFKDKAVPLPEIARQLGVTHIVEGTVKRSGNRVRITAKLINAADGFQLWASENLDREVKDSLALQDEIAGLIAKGLSLKLGAPSPAATAAVNPEAFRLYLEGREAWSRRPGRGDVVDGAAKLAESLFEQSVAIDPGFARAHASLALLWVGRNQRGPWAEREEAPDLGDRARAAIERALAIDPGLSEAYTARARLHWKDERFEAAATAFQQAIALNPNDGTAHFWYGAMVFQRGRLAEGIGELEVATRLDPLAPIVVGNYSASLRDARRWTDALAAAERALMLRPNSGEALRVRVDALIELGRMAEARTAFEAVEAAGGSRQISSRADQVLRLVRMGDRAGAEKLAEPILNNMQGSTPMAVFKVLVALDRAEDGFAHIEQGNHRIFFGGVEVALRPVFDPVRNDPRFLRKVEEAGVLAEYREAWTQYLAWKKKTGEP